MPNVDEILEKTACDFFWVPDGVEVVEREEITYTHSSRPASNYNNVPRVRPGLADLDELVDEVLERHRGGKSRWAVTPMSDEPPLREALDEAGYRPVHEHHAYAISTGDYDRDVPDDVEVREVASIDDLQTLYDTWRRIFGGAPDLSEQDLAREVDTCTGPDRRVARFVAYRNGEPAGSGGLTFFDDLSFGTIWAGGVCEEHRGRGVYTSLLQARADTAADHGLERIGLYARDDTSAPIVEAHGFTRHGPMTHFYRDLRD